MSSDHHKKLSNILKCLIIFATLLSASSIYAYNDSLVLINGDCVVGELKVMDRNVVIMKTVYSDSDFKIKWHRVREIYSDRLFIFTFSYGMNLKGTINTDPDTREKVIIREDGKNVEARLIDIVYIKAIEGNFKGSFDAAVDFGYTFTKDQNQHQLSMNTNFGYRREIYKADASYDLVRTKQTGATNTKRTEASIGLRFFLRNNWFMTMSSDFLQSDELKLKLRITTKPGVGKNFINNNKNHLNGIVGLAWNNEKYTEPEGETRNSMEFFAGPEYELYKIHDFRIFTSFTWYPSITENGRHRFDYKIDLKYDLPLDFYVKGSYTQNYDNRPVEGASTNDNILQISFGWDFNK